MPINWSDEEPLTDTIGRTGPNSIGAYCIYSIERQTVLLCHGGVLPIKRSLARWATRVRAGQLPQYLLYPSNRYMYRWTADIPSATDLEMYTGSLLPLFPGEIRVAQGQGRPAGTSLGPSPIYTIRVWAGVTSAPRGRPPLSLTMQRYRHDASRIEPGPVHLGLPQHCDFLEYLAWCCHRADIKHPSPVAITGLYAVWLRAVRAAPHGDTYQAVSRADLPLTLPDLFAKVRPWSGATTQKAPRWWGKDPG